MGGVCESVSVSDGDGGIADDAKPVGVEGGGFD